MEDKKLHEFEGTLQTYYETGMEGRTGLILQDKRGITPNPDYIPGSDKYPHDIPFWHSLSYCVWFRGGEEIEVYAKDGVTVEYRGPLTKDRQAILSQDYPQVTFVPKEVPKATWIKWFVEERKAKAWSTEAPIAETDPHVVGKK